MEHRKKWLFTLALALILALSSLGASVEAGAVADGEASVTLTVDQDSFAADQAVMVRVTIANPTRRPLKVLKWFTPAEDIEEPLFAVSLNGQPAAYLGAYYKRPEPKGEDYITLKAGESLTRDVDLSAYYDLSATGSYTVRYEATSPNLYSEKGPGFEKRIEQMTSNEVVVYVEGRQAPVLEAVAGSTTYNRCTTSQQSTLVTARAQASTYSSGALSYLNAGTQGPRYTTWFGVYSSSRYNTVQGNFNKISSAMDTAAVKFDCGCKKKYYAYVYPTQPYTIYLCSVFWSAPMTGTDSKAGTLIHEMSHFNVVAGTDDYIYGQSGAKSLAISDPNKAIDNADNHEYFAENTPALP